MDGRWTTRRGTILVTLTVLALVATFVVGWIKRATTRYRVTDRRINDPHRAGLPA